MRYMNRHQRGAEEYVQAREARIASLEHDLAAAQQALVEEQRGRREANELARRWKGVAAGLLRRAGDLDDLCEALDLVDIEERLDEVEHVNLREVMDGAEPDITHKEKRS